MLTVIAAATANFWFSSKIGSSWFNLFFKFWITMDESLYLDWALLISAFNLSISSKRNWSEPVIPKIAESVEVLDPLIPFVYKMPFNKLSCIKLSLKFS